MFRRAMKRAVQNAMRLGAKGIKIQLLAAVWAVLKSHVPNGTAKVVCLCTPCVQTSITPPTKRTLPTALLVLKFGSSKAKLSAVF